MTGPPPASPPPQGICPPACSAPCIRGTTFTRQAAPGSPCRRAPSATAAPTIGEIAGQISVREHPAPEPPAGVSGPGSVMTAPDPSLLPPAAAAPGQAAAALTRA